MNELAHPVGGKVLSRPIKAMAVLFGLGALVLVWRFASGLGAPTALNDGYPWGIWITYDVVVGTALACGGYAVASLCYILNRGQYHPLVRPAILTSALGYTLAGFAIVIDVGRYWNLYKVVVMPHLWNLNSILLEVALCVMAYILVLWIELFPAQLEAWQGSPSTRLRRFAMRVAPRLDKALIWIIAMGLLLPTLHQSSLGSLMMLALYKLDPLWHTPLLPVLFLISCIAMGYAVVVFEATLSSVLLKRPRETKMLASLSASAVIVIFLFLMLRFLDLSTRDQLHRAISSGWLSFFLILETAAFLAPALILLSRKARYSAGMLFFVAMIIMFAGSLYRFNVYLIGFDPGGGWSYFPSVFEILVTVGFIALEVLVYIVAIRKYPILAGRGPKPASPAPAPAPNLGDANV